MARPLRIQFPGAVYHITSRGNEKQNIFLDDTDRSVFLNVLEETVKIYNWLCHAYSLMSNHNHLSIETPDGNLSDGMHHLNSVYSQKFNKRHQRVGHLFQGRYKSILIEKEGHLLEVARYSVINQVRAGMVKDPADWPWSSYQAMVGLAEVPNFLTIDWLLGNFSEDRTQAQKMYRDFVLAGICQDSPFDNVQEGNILGCQQYIDFVWDNVTKGSEQIKDIPRFQRIVGRPTLEEIFSETKSRKDRNRAIQFAKLRFGYLGSEIAHHLDLDRSTVGKIVRGTYNIKK